LEYSRSSCPHHSRTGVTQSVRPRLRQTTLEAPTLWVARLRRTSPSLPVLSAPPRAVNNDGWTDFVSKISGRDDRLLYSSFLGGSYRSSVNTVKVNERGAAFVVGSSAPRIFPLLAPRFRRRLLEPTKLMSATDLSPGSVRTVRIWSTQVMWEEAARTPQPRWRWRPTVKSSMWLVIPPRLISRLRLNFARSSNSDSCGESPSTNFASQTARIRSDSF
jgi:hypothetical protein